MLSRTIVCTHTLKHDWTHCRPLRVVGAMSGTSMDGIDVACVEIQPSLQLATPLSVRVLATDSVPYPPALRQRILDIASGLQISLPELSQLDDAIANAFSTATLEVTSAARATPNASGCAAIDLIGSHGQTVFHKAPDSNCTIGHSIQLGRGETISMLTGIPTVSNFRAADIAIKGHGAPLVPRVDALLLRAREESRCIQNVGGIGNVTYLPALQPEGKRSEGKQSKGEIIGWDTGPGNVLIDLAVARFSQGELSYDRDGQWAAQGTPHAELVDRWLQAEFFQQQPPKSTGRELYSPAYLEQCLADCAQFSLSTEDILATLTDFTAASIADSYQKFLIAQPDRVAICGGGVRNAYLMKRLQLRFGNIPVVSTAELGMDPDYKEAIAFAVLAYLRVHHIPGNLPSVTGAADWCLLGDLHVGKKQRIVAQYPQANLSAAQG